jgi:FkbM family methyltransferase
MIIRRILQNIQRRKRAKRFGFDFVRLKNFSVPQQIMVNGKNISLLFPNEPGIWSAFAEIFLEDGYGFETLCTKPVKTIADIGANIGFFSVCARQYFPSAAITAYEPNYHLEKYLSHQLRQVNAIGIMEAVGKNNAKINLQFDPADSIMTRVTEEETASIPQKSFREVLAENGGNIDLLKLDCEGAEWQILEDHESMRHVKWLVMEYHLFGRPGNTEKDIVSLVEQNKFRILQMRCDIGFGFIMAERIN